MDINDMIELQRQFDAVRETTFRWSEPIRDGSTAALSHNALALAGEVGELANLVKKLERGDFGFGELMASLPGELADILIYVLKIAYQSDVDLERAFLSKVEQNRERFDVAADDS